MALTAQQLADAPRRKRRLIEMCKSFPKVRADDTGKDHIAFRVQKRIFAYYLFDHHGDGIIAFTCKSNLSEQRRLVREDPEEFFVPDYVGPKGWVAIRMDLDEVDWNTIEELARQAYLQTAMSCEL
jgi:phosphoribosylglycinamide formyltransferase-1